MKRYKPLAPTEAEEQAALFQWVALHPDDRVHYLFHIPNQTAYKLENQGILAGVSDMFLPVQSRGYGGLWIELKRITGGSVSDAQSDWLQMMALNGYACSLATGAQDAIQDIEWYLELV